MCMFGSVRKGTKSSFVITASGSVVTFFEPIESLAVHRTEISVERLRNFLLIVALH